MQNSILPGRSHNYFEHHPRDTVRTVLKALVDSGPQATGSSKGVTVGTVLKSLAADDEAVMVESGPPATGSYKGVTAEQLNAEWASVVEKLEGRGTKVVNAVNTLEGALRIRYHLPARAVKGCLKGFTNAAREFNTYISWIRAQHKEIYVKVRTV